MAIETRGIPTVMICTDEFSTLARNEAESLGMPALPLVRVTHPLGGQRVEAILHKAEAALNEVATILTMPRAELVQQFLRQV